MKITLDHNCIIHLEQRTDIGECVRSIVNAPDNECFVVNIGASEMREKGIRPESYELFDGLLKSAGIDHLPRIDPMLIFDVTFWDKCVFAEEEEIQFVEKINAVLFGSAQPIDIANEGLDSPAGRKWLNRICDVHSLFCHIKIKNDVFVTVDRNFMKKTKLPKLLVLGVGRICHPCEI